MCIRSKLDNSDLFECCQRWTEGYYETLWDGSTALSQDPKLNTRAQVLYRQFKERQWMYGTMLYQLEDTTRSVHIHWYILCYKCMWVEESPCTRCLRIDFLECDWATHLWISIFLLLPSIESLCNLVQNLQTLQLQNHLPCGHHIHHTSNDVSCTWLQLLPDLNNWN